MLDNHFWFDLNQGKSINASDGSSYHIQHVVRNPKKFGFEGESHMQQHASYPLEDIKSGYRDIDYNLEHHVMGKGFARGYHSAPNPRYDNEGSLNFDVANEEHLGHAIKHFLPLVKSAEEKGGRYYMDVTVGNRAKGPKYYTFRSSSELEQHLGKIAPKLQSKEPETFKGVGQVGEPLRKKIKDAFKKKDPSTPNWKLEQDVGYSTGSWGDSVEYKNFKQCFSEAMKKKMNKKKW